MESGNVPGTETHEPLAHRRRRLNMMTREEMMTSRTHLIAAGVWEQLVECRENCDANQQSLGTYRIDLWIVSGGNRNLTTIESPIATAEDAAKIVRAAKSAAKKRSQTNSAVKAAYAAADR